MSPKGIGIRKNKIENPIYAEISAHIAPPYKLTYQRPQPLDNSFKASIVEVRENTNTQYILCWLSIDNESLIINLNLLIAATLELKNCSFNLNDPDCIQKVQCFILELIDKYKTLDNSNAT